MKIGMPSMKIAMPSAASMPRTMSLLNAGASARKGVFNAGREAVRSTQTIFGKSVTLFTAASRTRGPDNFNRYSPQELNYNFEESECIWDNMPGAQEWMKNTKIWDGRTTTSELKDAESKVTQAKEKLDKAVNAEKSALSNLRECANHEFPNGDVFLTAINAVSLAGPEDDIVQLRRSLREQAELVEEGSPLGEACTAYLAADVSEESHRFAHQAAEKLVTIYKQNDEMITARTKFLEGSNEKTAEALVLACEQCEINDAGKLKAMELAAKSANLAAECAGFVPEKLDRTARATKGSEE